MPITRIIRTITECRDQRQNAGMRIALLAQKAFNVSPGNQKLVAKRKHLLSHGNGEKLQL